MRIKLTTLNILCKIAAKARVIAQFSKSIGFDQTPDITD